MLCLKYRSFRSQLAFLLTFVILLAYIRRVESTGAMVLWERSLLPNNTLPIEQILFVCCTLTPQLNGTVVLASSPSIKGNIVLAPLTNPPNSAVMALQEQGAIAVVMEGFPEAFGVGELQTILAPNPVPKIPFYNIGRQNFVALVEALANRTNGVNATLIAKDLNSWLNDSVLKITLALFIFDGAFCVAVIILATIQLALSIKTIGFTFNIPQASFILLIIGAIGNFFVTPIAYGPINFMNSNAYTVFTTFGIPFVLTTALLIALFWHEAHEGLTINLNMKLHRMKILAILLAILCFVVIFGMAFLRMAVRLTMQEVYYASLVVSIVFVAAISLLISAFYLASGIRISKLVRANNATGTQWIYPKKASATMIASSILLVLFAVVILLGLYINFIRPIGLVVYLFLMIAFENALSVVFIYGFSNTQLKSKKNPTHYQMELAEQNNTVQKQPDDGAAA